MPCFSPLKAYVSYEHKTKNGKSAVFFDRKAAGFSRLVDLPCGQCIGCRIDKSRSWALRCVHEASLYDNNCFLTLTYSDEYVPAGGSLVPSDFVKFMKRLRKRFSGMQSVNGKFPIRFFHCGEYGELLKRPHHHVCLFNFDFVDKVLWSVRNGVRLYRSSSLEVLWPFGHCVVGDVTFNSAAYVARYIMKKVTGGSAVDHYLRVDEESGEIFRLCPEYVTMSRRPGIARVWYERFKDDLYNKDFVTFDGVRFKAPRYYDKLFDVDRPEDFFSLKKKRLTRMACHADNNTIKRLRVRQRCLDVKLERLERSVENGVAGI